MFMYSVYIAHAHEAREIKLYQAQFPSQTSEDLLVCIAEQADMSIN